MDLAVVIFLQITLKKFHGLEIGNYMVRGSMEQQHGRHLTMHMEGSAGKSGHGRTVMTWGVDQCAQSIIVLLLRALPRFQDTGPVMLEVWDIIDSIPDTGSLDRAGLVGTAHRLVLIGGGVSGGGQDGGQQSTRRVAPDPDALGIQPVFASMFPKKTDCRLAVINLCGPGCFRCQTVVDRDQCKAGRRGWYSMPVRYEHYACSRNKNRRHG